MASAEVPIPGPWGIPVLGNVHQIDSVNPVQNFMKLAQTYGPIFKLSIVGKEVILISSQELVNEVCDEKRFDKRIHFPLQEIRDFAKDGLFTAHTQEPNWGKAHRILMPVFGPSAIKNMFPQMLDIAEQMMLKWDRQGPNHRIDSADNFTRLTLDTIALCGFNYRFNSFYEKDMHPFVGSMVRTLVESGLRGRRLPLQTRLMYMIQHQYHEDVRLMHEIADSVISERKKKGSNSKDNDILTVMLNAKDPQTGETLDDENIRYQLVTFLIAGHETTSGLLTFCLYEILKHPDVLAKAREEVDRVIGQSVPRFEHLAQLTYIDQILKETLRLWPTAPAFGVYPYAQDTLIGGKYRVRNDQTVLVLIPMLHRDPKVWGPNAEVFNPDNFSFANASKLPTNSWKPFGNGQRACIGRPFAIQEATLVLAMMLQRFDLSFSDPDYKLQIHETLTMKPTGLFVSAKRRASFVPSPVSILTTLAASNSSPSISSSSSSSPSLNSSSSSSSSSQSSSKSNGVPLKIYFGSNAGSAESFAQRIATDAKLQGYVVTLGTLDSAVGKINKDGATILVSASYEGQPPDNARKFVEWLDGLTGAALKDVKFAVFGVGNKDWARTYQAIPKKLEEKFNSLGALSLMTRGEANARGDFFGDFDEWYAPFWTTIGTVFGQEARESSSLPLFDVEFLSTRVSGLTFEDAQGLVVANRELTTSGEGQSKSKRHIEIALPEGVTYRTGDYVAVTAQNHPETVDRALRHFCLTYDSPLVVKTSSGIETFFPTNKPVLVGDLLSSFVELSQPATRNQIDTLANSSSHKIDLKSLATDEKYENEILDKRVSVLDLLERFPVSTLSFASFLQMLPPLKPRQYSISSSPLWSADHVTLTIAVVSAPALSGQGHYRGVASTYLAHSRPGSKIQVAVRPSQLAFHPPQSLSTPIIMVCAGTGIAPFRGFLQDRALRIASNQGDKAAPAMLFFGCASPDLDYLYKEELASWEAKGIVSIRTAFSQKSVNGVKHVQDRLWQDRADVVELVKQGAYFFLCGDGRFMAPAVHETCVKIYQEATGASKEDAEKWMNKVEREQGRYVADVFS